MSDERFYNHTQYLAEQRQQRQQRGQWEAVEPAEITRAAAQIAPYGNGGGNQPPSPIIEFSSAPKSSDDPVSTAQGTRIKARELAMISLPVTVGMVGLAGYLGFLKLGPLGYIFTILFMWGAVVIGGFVAIVKTDNQNTATGVEHHKVDASERYFSLDREYLHEERKLDHEYRMARLNNYHELLRGDHDGQNH